jgi:hypothetical protein
VEKNGERAKVRLQGRAAAICQQGQAAVVVSSTALIKYYIITFILFLCIT